MTALFSETNTHDLVADTCDSMEEAGRCLYNGVVNCSHPGVLASASFLGHLIGLRPENSA